MKNQKGPFTHNYMTIHPVKRLSLRSRSNERRLSAKDTLDPIKRLMDQQKVPVNGSPGSQENLHSVTIHCLATDQSDLCTLPTFTEYRSLYYQANANNCIKSTAQESQLCCDKQKRVWRENTEQKQLV